jgi:BioD-like phosphotransacetylase family protein
MDIPILSVDLDTLSTVEIIENAFGHVRLHEGIKKNCAFEMGQAHLDIHRLFSMVGVATKV